MSCGVETAVMREMEISREQERKSPGNGAKRILAPRDCGCCLLIDQTNISRDNLGQQALAAILLPHLRSQFSFNQ
jgi:hypothetical protein